MLGGLMVLICLGAGAGGAGQLKKEEMANEMGAWKGVTTELLKDITQQPDCGAIFLSDTYPPDILVQELDKKWTQWRGAALFRVKALKEPSNAMLRFSRLVPLARRVRQLSPCTTVVVVSYDLVFLVGFAEWSLKGRLLVWATRLLVVTHLTLSQLQGLLSAYWTFSMMNTMFFNKNDSSRTHYHVLSYFPYSPMGPQLVQVASWVPSRGLVIADGYALFQEKFSKYFFHGFRMNVTALPFPPLWEELEGPDNTHRYRGTDYNLLLTIAAALNFTFRVVPTSSWAEATRLVEERVAFLCSINHIVLPQRREQYDFSFVYEYASMDFCMAPPGLQPRWKAFYYPLSGVVWGAMLLALFITPCFLFFVIRSVNQRTCSSVESGMSYGSALQDMTGMLLAQNLPRRLPRTSSTRVLVATWLVFAVIFASAYCGNLTASLTLPKYPSRPETISQLVDSVKKVTMPKFGEVFKLYYSKSESPLFQKLASLMDIVPSLMAGQQQAAEKNQAHMGNGLHLDYSIAKWFTRPDGSEMLYIGRDSIMSGQSALPLPHDAPYAANIDRLLMAVVQAGLYEKWASDLLFKVRQEKRVQQREQQEDAEQKPTRSKEMKLSLSMDHMQGAFVLLLLGLTLAALVFGGELMSQNFV